MDTMSKTWTTLLALALACPLAIGCGQTSEKGGPGAKPAAGDDNDAADDEKTFTITVPDDMSIEQGAKEPITITVNRGDEFTEKVALTIETPEGVTADPATIDAAADQEEVKLMLNADAAAAAGEHTVTVKAKPETGTEVSESFKVTVDAKEE
jgi:uncharacterized membrane protein